MKYRIYRPSGHDEMVRVPEDEDGGGYGYVNLCEMLQAEMEIAKLEDERQDWEDQSVLVELQRARIAKQDAEIERLTKELDTWTCRPFFPRG